MSGAPPRRSTRGKRGTEEEAPAAAPEPVPEPKPKGKKGRSVAPPDDEARKAADAATAELERARAADDAVPAVPPPLAPIAVPADAPPPPPEAGPPATPLQAALSQEVPASEPAIEKAASLSQGAPMEASQGTASQGTVEGVEAASANPMSMMFYDVRPGMSRTVQRKLNELLPSMAWQKGVPWEALEPYGTTTPIVAFTLTLTDAPYGLTDTPELSDDEFAKIAVVGLFVLYGAPSGTMTLRILDMGTRNDLRPTEGGFTVDPYLAAAMQKLAVHVRTITKTPSVLVTYSRKQRPWLQAPPSSAAAAASAARGATTEQLDHEYLTTMGTLATLGFAYSSLNAEREYVRLRLGPDAAAPAPLRWSVSFKPSAEGLDRVEYSYAPPATRESEVKVQETETATFANVDQVQRFSQALMNWEESKTLTLHAPLAVLTGTEDDLRSLLPPGVTALPERIPITVAAPDAASAPPDAPRRGGRRTYRKKARKGKTAKRRH